MEIHGDNKKKYRNYELLIQNITTEWFCNCKLTSH